MIPEDLTRVEVMNRVTNAVRTTLDNQTRKHALNSFERFQALKRVYREEARKIKMATKEARL